MRSPFRARLVAVWLAAMLAGGTTRALADVRVVEDEVVFSLRAPGAKEVFLVGDFNNWNPTYEKMTEEEEGGFRVRLFLLPGTYRYKFVVDGKWIADPDRPPADPSQGSLLVLVEKGGALVIGSEGPAEGETGAAALLVPSMRYAGAFVFDDGRSETRQMLDVWLSHTGETARARACFETSDESWHVSPLRAKVFFDRARVDLVLGEAVLTGFENDTVWSSSDPFRLVGGAGIWGYNGGFDRRGFAAEVPFFPNTRVRGLVGDARGGGPGPPLSIESEALAGLVGSSGDTLVYRAAETFRGEDVWALEFAGGTGRFEFGYARRENRGYHPGLLAEVSKTGTSPADTVQGIVYTTQEFWRAGVGWLRWGFSSGFWALVGLARGETEVRTAARSGGLSGALEPIGIGPQAEPFEKRFDVQKDTRWVGGLGFEKERVSVSARYERDRFDFGGELYAPASAIVGDLAIEGSYGAESWVAKASLLYLDQDYGDAPDDFHLFTPHKNAWLDGRDQLTAGRMVSFDLGKSTEIRGTFSWGTRTLFGASQREEEEDTGQSSPGQRRERASGHETRRTSLEASFDLVWKDFFARFEHASLRVALERRLREHLFAQWDSRLARYDKASWGWKDTFFSTYVEAGYRNRWTETSVGIGFDPVILDPIVNGYADVGREEFVRGAIPPLLRRSGYRDLGEDLRKRENSLEGCAAVKLEIVLVF